jgi:hypothetical protein
MSCEGGGCRSLESRGSRPVATAPSEGLPGHSETIRAQVGVFGGARVGGTGSWGAAHSSSARVRDGAADGGCACVLGAVGRACAAIWLWVCRAQGEATAGGERGGVPLVVFREGQAWQAGVVGVGPVTSDAALDHSRLDSADAEDRLHDAHAAAQARRLLRLEGRAASQRGSGSRNDLACVPRRGTRRARQSRSGTATGSVSKRVGLMLVADH